MRRLLSSLLKFLRESWEEMGEASVASSMQMEGYTDFEIDLELNRLRKWKEKSNVQHVDEPHEGSSSDSSDAGSRSGRHR